MNFCWLWQSFTIKNITKYERYSDQTFVGMNILYLLYKNTFFEKIGWKSAPPPIGLKSGHFWAFFWFRPVQRRLWWETDKNKIFLQHTSHNVCLPEKISCTHIKYLKKDLKKKKNTQILGIEISSLKSLVLTVI